MQKEDAGEVLTHRQELENLFKKQECARHSMMYAIATGLLTGLLTQYRQRALYIFQETTKSVQPTHYAPTTGRLAPL